MNIDLAECRAKIKRAHEHRDGLQAIIRPVIRGDAPEADLVQLSAKLDPQSGYHVFRVAAIPEDWRLRVGVVLGDVVHNLRGALDYLYWQLYCHHIRVPQTDREAKQVQFPIEDTGKRLADKRVHVKKIPSRQWAVIDDAQPYNGADPPRAALKALRELSNRDKHRALNPLLLQTTMIQMYDPTLAACATTDFEFPHSTERALGDRYLEIGTEIVRVGLPTEVDPEVKVAGHVTPAVQLPEMKTNMLLGVDVMIRAVGRIVERIETRL